MDTRDATLFETIGYDFKKVELDTLYAFSNFEVVRIDARAFENRVDELNATLVAYMDEITRTTFFKLESKCTIQY